MLSDFSKHIMLLLFFRHRGSGLNIKSGALVAFLFALAALMAFLRWDVHQGKMGTAIAMLVFLSLLASFRIRAAIVYALISMGIDVVAIAILLLAYVTGATGFQEHLNPALLLWEIAAFMWFEFFGNRKNA